MHTAIFGALIAAWAIASGTAHAQGYPQKSVRIVTSEVGGGSDFVSRMLSQALGDTLGQRLVVDNRGSLSAEIVAKAPPDGYTLLLYGNNAWIAPLMRENPLWDVIRDFVPITLATTSPNVLVVHPSLPVKSVAQLIALARARPGSLNYGSGSGAATSYLAVELFKALARVDIVRIGYKGAGPALNALIAGQVQLMIPTPGSATPHINSGRLRALAVTSAEPSALLPGLPTVAASGVPGYEAESPFGIFAPAGTPPAIVGLLNQEFVRTLNRAEIRERFFKAGIETVGSTPEQFAAKLKTEIARWSKVIKEAGIRE